MSHHKPGGAPSYNYRGWYNAFAGYLAAKTVTATQRYPDQVIYNGGQLGQTGIYICVQDNDFLTTGTQPPFFVDPVTFVCTPNTAYWHLLRTV
jgi:hypothetical protein